MTITPQLSRKLQEALGDEAAADLMTWLQRMDAQRAELRDLNEMNFARIDARLNEARHESKADLADFRLVTQADIAKLREETRADIATLRGETQAGLAAVREEMVMMRGEFRAQLERRFGHLLMWSFAFWVSAVGAIALFAGVPG